MLFCRDESELLSDQQQEFWRGGTTARSSIVNAILAALTGVMLFSPEARGQQSPSGIAGVVKDTSGSVLPGVTVEASSAALIEKIRTVLTDSEGQYKIVDVRPGPYAVTFSLAGFSTLRREGIELTAGFTATVNADMQVGALEETVTVTGASPLVDTQNVRQQKVISNELLEVLPVGTNTVGALVTLTPGFTGQPDVGGSAGAYANTRVFGVQLEEGVQDGGDQQVNGDVNYQFLNSAPVSLTQ